MTVIILDPAEDDLVSIHDYYERQRRGLGKRFLAAFQDALTYLERFPRGFAKVYKNVRLCTIERFPYGIFFTVGSKFVFVARVIHLYRHPRQWLRLLR